MYIRSIEVRWRSYGNTRRAQLPRLICVTLRAFLADEQVPTKHLALPIACLTESQHRLGVSTYSLLSLRCMKY